MKLTKFSSLLLLSVFFGVAFMPDLSARSHFSFNLNVGPRPCCVERPYYVAPAPVVAPVAPVAAPGYVVQPYAPGAVYYPAPVYREVVVQRPYRERVYVHPHFSYWRY